MAPILRAFMLFLGLVLLQGRLDVHAKCSALGDQDKEQAFIQDQTWISPSCNPAFCGTIRHLGECPRISQWIQLPIFKKGLFVNLLSRQCPSHLAFYPAFLEPGFCVIQRFGLGKQFLSNVCLWLI
jgi:hypothetical protein